MNKKTFAIGTVFESDTLYVADREIYHIYPSDPLTERDCWWTYLATGGGPLKAAFVLRGLKNVTVDLGGAKLVFHGRIMPFSVTECENITLRGFSIDYDRPYYTQGDVLAAGDGYVDIRIPESFPYRVEGHDFIAMSEFWEHNLCDGDMLFRCMDPATGRPSNYNHVMLGLIGDEIFPRPNPPLPIAHLLAEDLGGRTVRLTGLQKNFRPRPGEVLAMTHEDRRKTGILLEENRDVRIEEVRFLHCSGMGIMANLCHNITLSCVRMFADAESRGRVISINADCFHCFHCTGLMRVENCRFESMLDDGINVHGNYLTFLSREDDNTILAECRAAALWGMKYYLPGDRVTIYRGATQEVLFVGTVRSAEYLPGERKRQRVVFAEAIPASIKEGDCMESEREPEIEVRRCRVKSTGGFRISSGKRVVVEDCHFETAYFSILFSGDMHYWFENGPVKDVTVRNCTFDGCGRCISTECFFEATEAHPFYHSGLKFENNTVQNPRGPMLYLKDMRDVTAKGNRILGAKEGYEPLHLERCENIIAE